MRWEYIKSSGDARVAATIQSSSGDFQLSWNVQLTVAGRNRIVSDIKAGFKSVGDAELYFRTLAPGWDLDPLKIIFSTGREMKTEEAHVLSIIASSSLPA